MKLNTDRTKAQLTINTETDAAGVEQLIRALAVLRSQMQPGVPAYPGANTPTISHDGPALLMDNPAADGSVVVRLCSSGLGWTSWRLPAGDVEAIRVGLESFKVQSTAASTGNQH